MKQLCFLFLGLLPLAGISQTKLSFSYDAAGNQVLRDLLCVNCRKAAPPTTVEADEIFLAAPNPVTHKLRVQWVSNKDNPLMELILYTSDGRLLLRRKIDAPSGQIDLDFSKYATGMYVLRSVNKDGSASTTKIIRQLN